MNTHYAYFLLLVLLALSCGTGIAIAQPVNHTFALGSNEFLLDGKPFQIISGELHYARIPKEYWRHRLQMARGMGLNTITTYVFWNYHETAPGIFDFRSENRDLAAFIRLAQEEGLWVIVRPGPYVCAEWDFGGYPGWLLRDNDLIVRSNDRRFLDASRSYLKRLGDEIGSLQITKGGPIIMVQVENEYGSYGSDKMYMGRILNDVRNAGFDVPYFTADGPTQCKNGYVDGVLPAINGDYNPQSVRDTVMKYNHGQGPFFVPEFYPGWLDHWGEKKSVVPVDDFIGKFEQLLTEGISVNLYMFHGGTNFVFMNGANHGGHFQPQPTSYDYDAPLDESGIPTPKYYRMRDVIKRHLPAGTEVPDVPKLNPIITIPQVSLTASANVFESLPQPVHAEKPLAMEELGQSYGYILYRTTISGHEEASLVINDLRDYATVYLDRTKIGSLDRRHKQKKLTFDLNSESATLDILVENGGRINYGELLPENRKGILGQITLNGSELTGWDIYTLPMDDPSRLQYSNQDGMGEPTFYRGSFSLDNVGDTYLSLRGWGKGCAWINGHNLGRYWYIGPQQTLYVPGVWLRKGDNEVIVFEMEETGFHSVQGLKEPILSELRNDVLAPQKPVRPLGKLILNTVDLVNGGAFMPGDSLQTKTFYPLQAQYVCLRSISSLAGDAFASIAEFYILDEQGNQLDRAGWTIYTVDSEELTAEDGRAENIMDGDGSTIWHTQWGDAKPNHPHTIVIDLGQMYTITGFQYQSRRGNSPGKIHEYQFYARTTPFELK